MKWVVLVVALMIFISGCISEKPYIPPSQGNASHHVPQTVNKTTLNKQFLIFGIVAADNYTETEALNDSGVYMEFNPSIPVYPNFSDQQYFHNEYNHLILDVAGHNYSIAELTPGSVVLEKESFYDWIRQGETISISNGTFIFANTDWNNDENRTEVIFSNSAEYAQRGGYAQKTLIPEGKDGLLNGTQIHVWYICTYFFGCYGGGVSIVSGKFNLTDPSNNVTLTWENESTSNPALKSIFITSSSPIFERMTSNTSG